MSCWDTPRDVFFYDSFEYGAGVYSDGYFKPTLALLQAIFDYNVIEHRLPNFDEIFEMAYKYIPPALNFTKRGKINSWGANMYFEGYIKAGFVKEKENKFVLTDEGLEFMKHIYGEKCPEDVYKMKTMADVQINNGEEETKMYDAYDANLIKESIMNAYIDMFKKR